MRVVIVAGICVRSDAISAAMESQARLLLGTEGIEDVAVFAEHIDRPLPCASHVVSTSWELLRHPVFRSADLAIFHWGIHYGLFDALALGAHGDGPRSVCHFHNCTPLELVPDHMRVVIERSLAQMQLLVEHRVPTWTFSEFNRMTLIAAGLPAHDIAFVPFPIVAPRELVDRRRSGQVDLTVVGRFVPAKGQHVVLAALALIPPAIRSLLTVRFAGNAVFSDGPYFDQLQSQARELGLNECVEFVGQPDDEHLWRLYERSHVLVSPSFHEGLCIPVVEAYLAGCRVVGTTAGNLPYIVKPPDLVVEPGDPDALAIVLEQVARHLLSGGTCNNEAGTQMTAMYSAAAARAALNGQLQLLLGFSPT